MSYKASVSNIYELLDEDGGFQTPQVNIGGEDKASVKKTTPALAKTQAKPKQDAPKAAERPAQQKAPRQERSIDKRPPKEFSSPKAGEEETAGKERRVNHREGERRFDRERGGGRGAYVPRGNKRPFDRRSGTGRGREVTKGGAGKGNWGTFEDEQQVGEESTKQEEKTEAQEGQGEQAQTTTETPVEQKVEQKEEQKVPEEEEDKTRTLDEFLKSRNTVKLELPKPRQAGEGVTNPEWSSYVPLKKKEDETPVDKKEKKTEIKKKEVVPVDQVFEVQADSPSRQRRDRPYGNSQRGGRGGRRGGSSGKSAPNVQDEAAFPSLSTKA